MFFPSIDRSNNLAVIMGLQEDKQDILEKVMVALSDHAADAVVSSWWKTDFAMHKVSISSRKVSDAKLLPIIQALRPLQVQKADFLNIQK